MWLADFDAQKNEKRARVGQGCALHTEREIKAGRKILIDRGGLTEEEADRKIQETLEKSDTGLLLANTGLSALRMLRPPGD